MPQEQAQGYTPDQMQRIASKLGHTGDMNTFNDYLKSNASAMGKFNSLNNAAMQRYAVGGDVSAPRPRERSGPRKEPPFTRNGFITSDLNSPDPRIGGSYYGEEPGAGGGGFREDGTPRPIYSSPMLPQQPTGKQEAVPEGIVTTADSTLGQTTLNQSLQPRLPTGSVTKVATTGTEPSQTVSATGTQLGAAPTTTTTAADTATTASPTVKAANLTTTQSAEPSVSNSLAGVTGEQGTVKATSKINAEQQVGSSVSTLDAAQGTATQVEGAPTRTLEGGELVNPVADAQKAAAFTEQITAAQADPSSRATVQGQLATLMTSFDEGKTPAWAAGAMRNVTAQMAARGIGSSSMAGQALIQAALESSLPIATADAQTYANFEITNLNNKQARAMLSAQQRATFMGQEFDQDFQSRVLNSNKISEVANMNFTAEQAIAMENAQLANTVNLTNLSNKQAVIMAEAASLSQLDVSNLNNRQQAQVQNAQSFLDMDMANLTNEQQASMFKAQTIASSILTDAAAVNASRQFNATSDNQTDQFFSNLSASVSQFNATQQNAQSQFNAGQSNASDKFNQEVRNQRDQFNAQNSMVINQSNAQWRRQIATADTAAINRANEVNAKSVLDISNTAYNNLWQEHRDEMDWAYKQSDSAFERYERLTIAKLAAETDLAVADKTQSGATAAAAGTAIGSLLSSNIGGTVLGSIFGIPS